MKCLIHEVQAKLREGEFYDPAHLPFLRIIQHISHTKTAHRCACKGLEVWLVMQTHVFRRREHGGSNIFG